MLSRKDWRRYEFFHPGSSSAFAMAVPQAEFAVPVVPSNGSSSVLPNSHRSTASLTSVRHGSPANAEASSSKRRLDMADSSFRQRANGKKVERRVLPARIASSNTNAGSNTTSASRELDDMVMECFAKACALPLSTREHKLILFHSS